MMWFSNLNPTPISGDIVAVITSDIASPYRADTRNCQSWEHPENKGSKLEKFVYQSWEHTETATTYRNRLIISTGVYKLSERCCDKMS